MVGFADDEWPYNDFDFMRRCVAIWKQRGVYTSVTWQWPDGLACPEYSTSVARLESIVHAQNVADLAFRHVALLTVWILSASLMLTLLCCGRRRRRSVC